MKNTNKQYQNSLSTDGKKGLKSSSNQYYANLEFTTAYDLERYEIYRMMEMGLMWRMLFIPFIDNQLQGGKQQWKQQTG